MADLTSISEALAAACNTIPDAPKAHPRVPDQVHSPAIIVEPDEVDFATAMGRGHESWTFHLVAIIALASNHTSAQIKREEFFGGAHDIKDAIEDYDPDGAWQDVFVRGAQNFDAYQVGGVDYLGVRFTVDVVA